MRQVFTVLSGLSAIRRLATKRASRTLVPPDEESPTPGSRLAFTDGERWRLRLLFLP